MRHLKHNVELLLQKQARRKEIEQLITSISKCQRRLQLRLRKTKTGHNSVLLLFGGQIQLVLFLFLVVLSTIILVLVSFFLGVIQRWWNDRPLIVRIIVFVTPFFVIVQSVGVDFLMSNSTAKVSQNHITISKTEFENASQSGIRCAPRRTRAGSRKPKAYLSVSGT
ncbi:unnamed protein product [Mycena citricolor]|uniref:Uncharacterized protein n=1 Tax=Mycena citricolor TaxID=2018698 RepID=A0AAD2H1U5_9AGAR|nr:unnamed protein product [Mycena citricolor]